MHALGHIAGQVRRSFRSRGARTGPGSVGHGRASGSRIVRTWLRRFLLVWPLAPMLGGCVVMQDEPGDRTVLENLSPVGPTDPRGATRAAPHDAGWRLRLTRL